MTSSLPPPRCRVDERRIGSYRTLSRSVLGAPLVAGELESGSFRLAWTQDVPLVRWLALRLAVSGLADMAVAGLASWLVTWWAGSLDRAGMNQFGSFDPRDIVPVGYAAFAFALGVLLGMLLRKTVRAMARPFSRSPRPASHSACWPARGCFPRDQGARAQPRDHRIRVVGVPAPGAAT